MGGNFLQLQLTPPPPKIEMWSGIGSIDGPTHFTGNVTLDLVPSLPPPLSERYSTSFIDPPPPSSFYPINISLNLWMAPVLLADDSAIMRETSRLLQETTLAPVESSPLIGRFSLGCKCRLQYLPLHYEPVNVDVPNSQTPCPLLNLLTSRSSLALSPSTTSNWHGNPRPDSYLHWFHPRSVWFTGVN